MSGSAFFRRYSMFTSRSLPSLAVLTVNGSLICFVSCGFTSMSATVPLAVSTPSSMMLQESDTLSSVRKKFSFFTVTTPLARSTGEVQMF